MLSTAVRATNWASAGAFAVLGLMVARAWLRGRSPGNRHLAEATVLIAAVSVLGRMNDVTGYRFGVLGDVSLVGFVASGYAFLLFRDSFVPLSRRTRATAGAATAAVAVAALAARLPSGTNPKYTAAQFAVVTALIVVWSACVIEPCVRLWMASQGKPAVQRRRLQALSAGFLGIAVVLLAAVGAISAGYSDTVQLGLGLAVVMLMPALYASFVPPAWLRRLWSEPEQRDLREAIGELVLFGADRETLAQRALEWVVRLVGGHGGCVAVSPEHVLAVQGIVPEKAAQLVSELDPPAGGRVFESTSAGTPAIAVPLHLEHGSGTLVVLSGPFTPLFASEELDRLAGYAVFLAVALERVHLLELLVARTEEVESMLALLELRAGELARSNAALEEFAFIASHDLQEPLRMVTSYLELLVTRYRERLDADANEFVGFALEGAARMASLIEGLLNYSRAGGQMTMEPTNSSEALRQALENLQSAIASTGARVTSDSLPTVTADQRQLVQLFQNLIGNAMKFRRHPPPEVHVSCERAEQGWVFSVRDNGIGIESRHLDRIFMVFRRLHGHHEYPGTGIGLSICRKIVERHGGGIWVDSVPGEGSVFHFSIPDALQPLGRRLEQPTPAAAG